MRIPDDIRREIIDLLADFVHTDNERRLFVNSAFHDYPQFSRQLIWSGSTNDFAARLVDHCERYGSVEPGRPAIYLLLAEIQESVGWEKSQRVAAIVRELEAVNEVTPEPVKRHDRLAAGETVSPALSRRGWRNLALYAILLALTVSGTWFLISGPFPDVFTAPSEATATVSVFATDTAQPSPTITPTKDEDVAEQTPADIVIAGSATVWPLIDRVRSLFEDNGYTGVVTVDAISNSAGFSRFCLEAQSQVVMATRPIADDQRQNCIDIGRAPIELRVGTEAVVVAMPSNNALVDDLTLAEVRRVSFTDDPTWADVGKELEVQSIERFVTSANADLLYTLYHEALSTEEAEFLLPESSTFVLSSDQDAARDAVVESSHGIGVFTYAYYRQNTDVLQAVAINGVTPTDETVSDLSYPLSRPLLMYTARDVLLAHPQVEQFLTYTLNNVNTVAPTVGLLGPSAEQLAASRAALEGN